MILDYLPGFSHMQFLLSVHKTTLIFLTLAVAQNTPAAAIRPQPSPIVRALLEDTTLDEGQRRHLMIFHGQWDRLKHLTLAEQAEIALYRFQLTDPVLSDPSVPPLVRAKAFVQQGQPEMAIEMTASDPSAHGAVIRAKALVQLGQTQAAIEQLVPWRQLLLRDSVVNDAHQLVVATEALTLLARLEGRPSRDYQFAMVLLGKAHQELDRFHWPAKLAEARLLFEKDNPQQATIALTETLTLNPISGDAWYLTGRIGLDNYNFEQAEYAIK